jgi:3'5'-cyclic nucleotide phosphodiesterase
MFACFVNVVDHPGVPNPQLVIEDAVTAEKYKHRSVAEQKSLDIAMGLLSEERFQALRAAIFLNHQEAQRFRQLVVNVSAKEAVCFAWTCQTEACAKYSQTLPS